MCLYKTYWVGQVKGSEKGFSHPEGGWGQNKFLGRSNSGNFSFNRDEGTENTEFSQNNGARSNNSAPTEPSENR